MFSSCLGARGWIPLQRGSPGQSKGRLTEITKSDSGQALGRAPLGQARLRGDEIWLQSSFKPRSDARELGRGEKEPLAQILL